MKSEMLKIIEEAERATRIEYDTLSGLDPLDRHYIFKERLHGMHIGLLAASFVVDDPIDYHDTGEKIADMIRELNEMSYESAKNMLPEAEKNED